MLDPVIYQGDCLQVLPTLPDNSVDLVLTDPPYFKVKGEAWDNQWAKPTQFLLWLDAVVEQLARVMKPNGSLYLFASPQMAARVECQIAVRLNVLNHITWRKPGENIERRHAVQVLEKGLARTWLPANERIIFAEHYGADNIAKGEAGYAAKCDQLRGFIFEPLRAYIAGEWERAGLTSRDANKATSSQMAGHYLSRVQWTLPTREKYEQLRAYANQHGGDYLRKDYEELRKDYEELRRPFAVTPEVPYTDVWDFPTVQAYPGKHPCEKPQALLRHIITASSKPGAVVLDAFMGSGATGVACKALGRKFIGVELSGHWCNVARANIDAAGAAGDLFAA